MPVAKLINVISKIECRRPCKSAPLLSRRSHQQLVFRLNFAVGFFGAPEYLTAYHEEIIIESGGYNNTLAPSNACPDSGNAVGGNIGGWTSGNWTEIYLKETTARLQQYVTGVQLTPSVVYGMQQMCAYETVALGYSSFCELFTEEEWRGFEYSIGEYREMYDPHSLYDTYLSQTCLSGMVMGPEIPLPRRWASVTSRSWSLASRRRFRQNSILT